MNQIYRYDEKGNVTSTTLQSSTGDTAKIQTSATYSSDGNRIESITDSSGSTISYAYSGDNNLTFAIPTVTTDAKGNRIYKYCDAFGRVTSVSEYEITGSTSSQINEVSYIYDGFRLGEIKRLNSNNIAQYYRFLYDDFGNMSSVKVGDQTIARYEYGERNGPLLTLTYGNGDTVSYTYDRYGRLKTESYDTGTLTYVYNGEGLLYSILETKDTSNSLYQFHYDSLDRLLYRERFNDDRLSYRIANTYNDKSQKTGQRIQMEGMGYTQNYTYEDTDGSLTKMTIDMDSTENVDHTIDMEYDHLRRLCRVSNNLFNYQYVYEDVDGSTELTTNRIRSLVYSNEVGSPSSHYEYDTVGNITTYQDPGGTTTYEYDALSQLTKATRGSKIYTYTYDGAGNILTSSDGSTSHTYTYGNTNWKDLLTSYDGHSISYDGVGNPLTYYNGKEWELEWTDGRKLAGAESTNGDIVFYEYDVDGTRRSKNVNQVTFTYIWEDGKPIKEYSRDDRDYYSFGETLYFFYDQNGSPYALQYNGITYYYILNGQGDVIRLVDSAGTVVASYEYDPYGKVISATGRMAEINPLRYRGYYYDFETGFYLTGTRYYDPEIGRFINADGYVSTGQGVLGNNMFAYCLNNPVNMSDPTGEFAISATLGGIALWKIGVAIVGLVGTFILADTIAKNPPAFPSISLPKIESKPKSDSKEKDIAPAIPKDPPKKETVIYRYGGTNPGNFVPSPRDVATNSGLSFLTSPPPPGTKASVTTIEALNATGIVRAYQDKPGHVRVDPVIGTLADWRSGGSEHPCTIAVRSVVVKWDGGN